MEYYIKRKDDIVTLCDIADDGTMKTYAQKMLHRELGPLLFKKESDWIKRWWKHREPPISQGRVDQMLKRKGLIGPGEYLLKNLGLSLTDYYWICPLDSNLKWKDVNLFENDFKENLFVEINDMSDPVQEYTPNSSLQGELEKSWRIINGKRMLVKGNKKEVSTESINEVIATEFHEMQGYDNFTKYSLTKIENKEYDYGCQSENFVTQDLEYVSAYAVMTTEKRPNSTSKYEHLIECAGHFGIDKEQFRTDLEYQILSDYILSNRDRHMNNIGILRNAENLEFVCMAPIYDTGKSMFVHMLVPDEDEFDELEINSFVTDEKKIIKYVRDKNLIDTDKILPVERVRELYLQDRKMDIKRIDKVCKAYELKIKKFKSL